MTKMKLRKLKMKDAPFMLEWMHDEDVVRNMKANFMKKTLDDCEKFIKNSEISNFYHRAIVNDQDEYMGTVSLKNIDRIRQCAEFAITIRKSAMGKGYSAYGMQEIISEGFELLHLKYIYWYVRKENMRAIKFYEKMGYKHLGRDTLKKLGIQNREIEDKDLIWYGAEAETGQK